MMNSSATHLNMTTEDLVLLYGGAVDPAYGYLLLVVAATYCLSFWQGFMVGRMRTKLKVEYPAMYSDTEPLFNCYQRAHQNTLEKIPLFLALLFVAGLFNAKVATILGFLWHISRVIYSVGYYSGIPKNRVAGSLMSLITEFALLMMVLMEAGQLARWWTIHQLF